MKENDLRKRYGARLYWAMAALVAVIVLGGLGFDRVGASMAAAQADARVLDLSGAVVVTPPRLSGPEKKAIDLLIEEVERRTQLRWQRAETWPAASAASAAVIAVGTVSRLADFAGPFARRLSAAAGSREAEGYRIRIEAEGPTRAVFVIGNDSRGVLFGVGHLLRTLRLEKRAIGLPDGLDITTAPRYALRGHQIGYRPKTNSYDAWTLQMWEQYIRDLAVFGTNAVEIIPPRSDDAADSPHFPLPQIEMMEGVSRICQDYDLDLWIWYPAMDRDYADPKTVEHALDEWGQVFRRLPRIDAIFVPGGDPGHTHPRQLLSLLERQTEVLRRHHPRAQMWVSPQGFNQQWMDIFLSILRDEQPAWLSGIVHGPQVRLSLPQLRAAVPKRYAIRRYPDITHSRQSQYPVPDWDLAYALTEAREVINPRPFGQASIFRRFQDYAAGFITYSEGCNDDVNKMVWSALGWNPNADVAEILRDYSRYFISGRLTEEFAQGLMALERNWQGPLLTNSQVYTVLAQFQAMERSATPQELLNWRFQQALYRAYYDAYVRSRLLYETGLEDQARGRLREAGRIGSLLALSEAEAILDRGVTERVSADWRARVFELAEALYQSVRMQLSVERYQAIAVGRGANLDTIDHPLNNRLWLKQRVAELRKLPEEAERIKGINEILNWTNPGPGGFYDDLGNPAAQPHLVRGPGFDEDPAFARSALMGFAYQASWPMSWWHHAEALHDAPLRMRYTNLDPRAQYRIRVVYAGDSPNIKIRLLADADIEVHPFIKKESPVRPLEFDIPARATSDGELELSWYREPGLGANGRGCQVSEVWLIRN